MARIVIVGGGVAGLSAGIYARNAGHDALIVERHLPIPLSGVISGCDNVILATQWLQSPGGLPIAATSGKAAVDRIVKLEKKK